ncbi:epoxide hydrolase N-termina [Serendipita vermifera]|nr:epoxide hydrolase N-termina [Serendipita vermifera]
MTSRESSFRAVIFDIGGVVITSPLIAITAYERERGFPKDWINVLITGHGSKGAWQKFERGEIDLKTFYAGFSNELSDVEKGKVWYKDYCKKRGIAFPSLPPESQMRVDGRELFGRMMRGSVFDEVVVNAILKIRETKQYRVIAVTNNFGNSTVGIEPSEREFLGWTEGAASASPRLKEFFDDYIDSSEVGLRKPDPAIYTLACKRNGVTPREVIMLDDLGMNLRTAKELGITTIQVRIGDSKAAVRELGDLLGLQLLEDDGTRSRL